MVVEEFDACYEKLLTNQLEVAVPVNALVEILKRNLFRKPRRTNASWNNNYISFERIRIERYVNRGRTEQI